MVLCIFLLAFSLRAAALLELQHAYPFFNMFLGDAQSYQEWAKKIAAGHWLGATAFYQTPLYPYLLGLLYRLGGTALLARWLQVVLSSLSCILIYDAASRLFCKRTAFWAGLLSAGYGMFIFYDSSLLKESLNVFLSALLLWSVIEAQEAGAKSKWFSAGIILGLLVLSRGNALLLVFALLAWLLFRSTPFTALFFLCGVLLPWTAATAHNYVAARDMVLTTYQGGVNFYIGNNAQADGTFRPLIAGRDLPRFEEEDAKRIAEEEAGHALKPSEISRFWFAKAFHFIRSQPRRWLRLTLRKIRLFFFGYEIPDFEDYYLARRFSRVLRFGTVGYGLVCPLALLGMGLGLSQWRRLSLLYLYALFGIASIVVCYIFGRYRLSAVVPMLVFAGFALKRLGEWLALRQLRSLVTGSAALLLLIGGVNQGTQAMKASFLPGSLANMGLAYQNLGRPDKAQEYFMEAVSLQPGNSALFFLWGNLYGAQGNHRLAAEKYEEALKRDPENAQALFFLGLMRYKMKDYARARGAWEKVLRIFPSHREAREGLAALMKINS